jgi:hypothetical protein
MGGPGLVATERSEGSGPRPGRRLLLVHGRGWKPEPATLAGLWREALALGVARDHGGKLAKRLEAVPHDMVWYGDAIAPVLESRGERFDEALDVADRRRALAELAKRDRAKLFRRQYYDRLRGRSGLGKWLMVLSAPFARGLGMDQRLIERIAPELATYLDGGPLAEAARARFREALVPALEAGEDVMVIAHCLGSVVAYDVLRALSADGTLRPDAKVHAFVTLGSPLANDSVRLRLDGAAEPEPQRYPANLTHWFNLAAVDDYMCHDTTVANDFGPMLRSRLLSRLEDYPVCNLTRRYGRPNPHSAVGYLAHPRMAALVADWLGA